MFSMGFLFCAFSCFLYISNSHIEALSHCTYNKHILNEFKNWSVCYALRILGKVTSCLENDEYTVYVIPRNLLKTNQIVLRLNKKTADSEVMFSNALRTCALKPPVLLV